MDKPFLKLGLYVKFSFFMVVLGALGLMYSAYLYELGVHNIDLSVNVLRISYFENLNYTSFVDQTNTGAIVSYDFGYHLGLYQTKMSLMLAVASLFWFLGGLFGLTDIISSLCRKQK